MLGQYRLGLDLLDSEAARTFQQAITLPLCLWILFTGGHYWLLAWKIFLL